MLRSLVVKCIVIFSGILFLVSPFSAQERPVALLKSGTSLLLEITENVEGKTAKVGDIVKLRVSKEVKVDDAIIIKAGTEAVAKVADVKPAKGWGRKGAISMNLSSAVAVDGTKVLLSATQSSTGQGRTGGATAVGVVGGLVFFPLAFTGSLIKGQQGKLVSGAQVKGYVDGEYKIAVPTVEKTEGDSAEGKPSGNELIKGTEWAGSLRSRLLFSRRWFCLSTEPGSSPARTICFALIRIAFALRFSVFHMS